MSHQCPFPVHSTDNRRCYRTGSTPGFVLCLAVIAALSCFAGFGHAASSAPGPAGSQEATSSVVVNGPGVSTPQD